MTTTWKPDFNKADPYEGMPKEYATLVLKTYVPTEDNPLPPLPSSAIPANYAQTHPPVIYQADRPTATTSPYVTASSPYTKAGERIEQEIIEGKTGAGSEPQKTVKTSKISSTWFMAQPETPKETITKILDKQQYNLDKNTQQIYNWMKNYDPNIPDKMTADQIVKTWQSLPGKQKLEIQQYNATYKMGEKPVNTGLWGLVPFVDTVKNFEHRTVTGNVLGIANDVIDTVMIGGGIFQVGKGSIKLVGKISQDGLIETVKGSKVGRLAINIKGNEIGATVGDIFTPESEKAFITRLNKARKAQITMEATKGVPKFAPVETPFGTIKFDTPASKSTWRAITGGTLDKPYVYYIPKSEEQQILKFGYRIGQEPWRGRLAVKTLTPAWGVDTVPIRGTKSSGLGIEERLGAMTPEQAARIRGYIAPLIAKGKSITEIMKSPDFKEFEKVVTSPPDIKTSPNVKPIIKTKETPDIYTKATPDIKTIQSPDIGTKKEPATTTTTKPDIGTKATPVVKVVPTTTTEPAATTKGATVTDTKTDTTTQTDTKPPAYTTPGVSKGYVPPKPLLMLYDKTSGKPRKVFIAPKGTVSWKQGIGWWSIYPPYGSKDKLFTINKPEGAATIAPDARRAYDTIQKIGGKVPTKLPKIDMGIMDVHIEKPPSAPRRSNRESIRFTRDPQFVSRKSQRGKRVGPYYVSGNMISRHPIGNKA